MDSQRPFLYLSLVFVIFLIYQAWVTDHAPVLQETASQTQAAAFGDSEASVDLPDSSAPASLANPAAAAPVQEVSAPGQTKPATQVMIKTDVIEAVISTRGGDIVDIRLPTYPISLEQKDQPYQLLHQSGAPYIAQSGLLHEKVNGQDQRDRAPTHYADYSTPQTRYQLADGQDELRVPLTWTGPDGISVTKTYVFHRGDFTIGLDYKVNNASTTDWVASQYRQLRHGPVDSSVGLGMQTFTGAAYFTDKFHKLAFKDMLEEPVNQQTTGGWAAVIQHYFFSAWLSASTDEPNKIYSKVITAPGQTQYLIGMRSAPVTVAAGTSGVLHSRFYAGPKRQADLAEVAPGLELTVDYGIFTIFSKPLFWLLSKIHGLIGNWGWAIILLTILIKAVFYKLSEASYRSMAKMRKVAPKLKSLKERYGDDKARYQQAMMEFYKTEKINPVGGCLPIVIQIPVFIALYWMLQESVELRQAPWMFWIHDLSIKDPLYILPLLMGISMFIQQKLNPPQPDPVMQKAMMAMPIIFTVFFAFFPAGLVLYWITNNLLSISQQWYITRKIEQAG